MKDLHFVIDFGGTNIKYGAFSDDNIVLFDTFISKRGADFNNDIHQLSKTIKNYLTTHQEYKLSGIGIAIPGVVDIFNNRVTSVSKKYEQTLTFDFNKWANEYFNCPIILENDGRSALYGEFHKGLKDHYSNAVLFTLGTGIGTAAIIDNEVLVGSHYRAGILGGHFSIENIDIICDCGNRGCVEAVTQFEEYKRVYNNLHGTILPPTFEFKNVFDELRKGNEEHRMIIEIFSRRWGAGIVNLIHAYDPEVIVLSGGIMQASDIVLPLLKKYVSKWAWMDKEIPFYVAENPNESVLYGLHERIKEKRSYS